MSDVDTSQTSMATIPATRAAWLATAIGIPVYGATALIASYLAAPVVTGLASELTTVEDLAIFVGVAVINVAIALVGIALIAHTLGRLLFGRTRAKAPAPAGVAFAAMASALAAPIVAFVALGTDETLAGGVYAAIAVGLPCGFTAGLTRAVLPGVAASPAATRIAGGVAAAGVLVILAWTAVVLFGVGR